MSYGVMAPTVAEQMPYRIASGATKGPMADISRWRAGAVYVPAGAATTSFTFNVSNDADGKVATVYALRDAAGAAITQTVAANKWFPLPPSLFSYRFAELVPNAAPANVNCVLAGIDGPATWRRVTAPIAGSAAVTINVPTEGASKGSFLTPAVFAGATVTFEIGDGGVWSAMVDLANANVTQAVAVDRLLTIPAAAFGGGMLRIRAASNQAAGGALVEVWLKQEG
jgi:hypothetical protein